LKKVAPKVAISFGYFLFSKNIIEPPKVTQWAENGPIWSPWMTNEIRHGWSD